MTTMTRVGWEKKVMDGKDRLGGDLWNQDNIWRRAFRQYPTAITAGYDYIGTGLWVDVTLRMPDGSTINRRILC